MEKKRKKFMSLTVKWKFNAVLTVPLSEAADLTVGQLKERLCPLCGLPPDAQRLVHNGRVLADVNESLAVHLPLDKNSTIHVVGKAVPEVPPVQTLPNSGPELPPFMTALGLDQLPGVNAASLPESLGQYGGYLKGLLENPTMRNLIGETMTNSPMMREMLGPAADQVMDVLNDPQQRAWALDMACNPGMAREQMRINDMSLERALFSDPSAYGTLLNMARQTADQIERPTTTTASPITVSSEPTTPLKPGRTMIICMTADEADFWQRISFDFNFQIDVLLDRLRARFGSDPEGMVRWYHEQFPDPETTPLPPD